MVQIAATSLDEGLDVLSGCVEHRDTYSASGRELGERGNILEVVCGLAAGGELTTDHPTAAVVEHRARGIPGEHDLAGQAGIYMGGPCEGKSLAHGAQGCHHDQLVESLHDLA